MQFNLQRFSKLSSRGRLVWLLGTALAIAIGVGLGIVALVARRPPEVRLMQERIAILEQMITELETVTDKSSMDRARPAVQALSEKLTRLNEEFKALPEEAKQKANNSALSRKMQEVTARLQRAKITAHQASANPG